jgi:uncharacterized membrane protein YhhN
VAVSATFAIIAARRGDRPGVYLFKPLTTFIILLGAAWLIQPSPPFYRALVVAGLACSLAGDILLMLPADRFLAGLVAFLFAHLAYLVAFSYGTPVTARQLVWLLPFAAFAAVVLADRWSAAGKLKIPMVIYAAVICTMVWRAAMRGQAVVIPRQTFLFALFGACLFLVSDAIVLLRRFGRPFPAAQTLELATYWAAQSLIALSVRGTIA